MTYEKKTGSGSRPYRLFDTETKKSRWYGTTEKRDQALARLTGEAVEKKATRREVERSPFGENNDLQEMTATGAISFGGSAANGKALSGARPDAEQLSTPVPMGQETGAQTQVSRNGFISLVTNEIGHGRPASGTFKVYRRMRTNPTIAMAREAMFAPIETAGFTVEQTEDGDDDQVDFIHNQMTPLWTMFITDTLRSLDYGFQAFEKVFDIVDGKLGIRKLKPLWPDVTEPLVDRDTGNFMGLQQKTQGVNPVSLPAEKVFWYAYDMEAGNWFGRSKFENIRSTSWHDWETTRRKMAQYSSKVAGVIPLIQYPEGSSKDATGTVTDNYDLAVRMLNQLGSELKGFAMPNAIAKWAGDALMRGISPELLRPWLIQFLETKGNHGKDFIDMLRYHDVQQARGMLTPERSFQEGQHGTKAEAGEMIDIVLVIAEKTYGDIVRCANWYIVNQLLVLNFPNAVPGSVFLKPNPIIDEDRAWLRTLIAEALKGTMASELWAMLDTDNILESTGLPSLPESEREAALEEILAQRQAFRDALNNQPDPNDGRGGDQ